MLYSLLIALIVLAIATPVLCIVSFTVGYNANAAETGKRIDKPKLLPKKKPKGDVELETLLHNINVYDGTANGQKDFK